MRGLLAALFPMLICHRGLCLEMFGASVIFTCPHSISDQNTGPLMIFSAAHISTRLLRANPAM